MSDSPPNLTRVRSNTGAIRTVEWLRGLVPEYRQVDLSSRHFIPRTVSRNTMSAPIPHFVTSGASGPTAPIEMGNIHPRREAGPLTSHPVHLDEPPVDHPTLGVDQQPAAPAAAQPTSSQPAAAGTARPAVGRLPGTGRIRTDAVIDTRPTGFLRNIDCLRCAPRPDTPVSTAYAAAAFVLMMTLIVLVFVILILR